MADAVRERVKRHEGLRLQVYDDATGRPIVAGSTVIGNPTIGYGVLVAAPGGLTDDEAEALLDNRLRAARSAAARIPEYQGLDTVRRNVLVEMVYQLGLGGVLGFVHMRKHLYAGAYTLAAAEMLASRWAKQTPARAMELATIMRSGVEA